MPAGVAGDGGVDVELGEDVLEPDDDGVVGLSAGGVPGAGLQEVVAGQDVGGAVGQLHGSRGHHGGARLGG